MDVCEKIPVLAIAGPTASGKTALSVRLAKALDGEVISADSMQIYQGLQISTAKPTAEEMQGVPHHLLDFLPPDTPFSVADYCERAKECVADVRARGKLPILCGGTGLYMQSFLENIDFSGEGSDPDFRQEMQTLADTQGTETVWRRLQAVDPQGAETLHPNNLGRVIRALELYRQTGLTMAQQRLRSRKNPTPYNALVLCLDFHDRQRLYERIDRRVDIMLESGLLDEARAFYAQFGAHEGTARQAIGCKELFPYFEGACTLDEAVERIKRETRHYAKRQLTWFRRMNHIQFIYADDETDAFASAMTAVRAWR